MATKTFEELKQLAIQIRDEKTNKQNTATRIGTQMLEHLDKLEQDYYDKTATDEELKERDEKLTELEGKTSSLQNDTDKNTSEISETKAKVEENSSSIASLKIEKQDSLNFDDIPTLGSNNPVTSGGVRAALNEQKSEVDAAKEKAIQTINETEQSAITNFNAQRVTPEMLSEATKQLINTAGGGTINNLPDDEDLTSQDDGTGSYVMKLADRSYNPTNFSGKGYKIFRRNIVDGKNILTQDMINQANTVYDIRYDYDLNDAEITVPENCVLQFEGGSFSNGTLNCNNTEIKGTLGCFDKSIILDGTINGGEILFDWWKCEKSTIEEYKLFINGRNTEFGTTPSISETNRLILKNHINNYIISFGLGIYPFDNKIEIGNCNFRIKGIDPSKTLIWCPYSSFLYMNTGGGTYPFIKNISIEVLNNILCTLANKVNGIHGMILDSVKGISYADHVFYNDRSISGGTGCPIYGSKINFSQFYAGRDKGCFTNYTSGSNIYNNVVDAFQYFDGTNTGYKGIMRSLFWNSTVFELRESNILYGGMKYVAYYDNEITPVHKFNARRCIFEGAGNTEVAGERKGFLNIIKCDSTYGNISNLYIGIEDCTLISNTFDEGVAINLSEAVVNCYLNIPSNFYVYGTNNTYNIGKNTLYAISKPLDINLTKRRLLIYNNTSNLSSYRRENLIKYSQDIANSLNVPTALIEKCEDLGNISYISIGINLGKKIFQLFCPMKI